MVFRRLWLHNATAWSILDLAGPVAFEQGLQKLWILVQKILHQVKERLGHLLCVGYIAAQLSRDNDRAPLTIPLTCMCVEHPRDASKAYLHVFSRNLQHLTRGLAPHIVRALGFREPLNIK